MEDHFEAKYPWIKDPKLLPNNYSVALKRLQTLEKRLTKDPKTCDVYNEQILDMLKRKVARELTDEEICKYEGPVHYITHHAVVKPESTTTPLRIVFNTSLNYKGFILNAFWAKGPDSYISNLLKVLIRFREDSVAYAGDISKMYHTIRLSLHDQHTHRFLWRNDDANNSMQTLVMTAVSFGDRPAGTIAILALKKLAFMFDKEYPDACKVIALTKVYKQILITLKRFLVKGVLK